jgi:hypothetical protein
MGGTTFYTYAFGADADEAFRRAVDQAEKMHGIAPYSGTISEKNSYAVIPEDEHKGKEKLKYAGTLISEADARVDDKWGPAGAINVSGTQEARKYRDKHGLKGNHGDVWLFFGWASC